MKVKSAVLHGVLHRLEVVGHPLYFAAVAFFGHGGYVFAAAAMAVVTLLLLVVSEQ